MELSVVIPALNEADNLAQLLPQLHEVLGDLVDGYEIIVVDNHSPDATAEVCAKAGAVLVQQSEPGYGGALLAGFRRGSGDYILTMDADLSHVPDFVPSMWDYRSEAEVVIASRYVEEGSADMPWYRQALSVILNAIYTKALSLPVKDISSGFRLYHAFAVKGLDLLSNDFDVLEEILIKCYANGWRITEIPFHYVARASGSSKVRLLQFGVSYLKTLVRMWKLRNSTESADYDARAFDSAIPLQRYWQHRRYRTVLDMVDTSKQCLDIGCGSSRILSGLSADSIGLDVQVPKLRFARCYGYPLVNASVFALPFGDETFDQVICSQVIEHLVPGNQPFVEMARVLRKDGLLVIGTPDYGGLVWPVVEAFYAKLAPGAYADEHITHYTRRELVGLLEELGFRHNQTRYVCGGEMIASFSKMG